ncbi:TK/EGFR protein kinase [Aphelenchoides avenae]|nr:TK/EGFR protein kinase [Aphelenchus avenae]
MNRVAPTNASTSYRDRNRTGMHVAPTIGWRILLISAATLSVSYAEDKWLDPKESYPLRKWSYDNTDVCLGTDNGRNKISMDNDSNHYTRLFRSFVSCKRIIGNLELTHINQTDVYEHYNVTDVKLLNETVRQQVENPFWFLNDLEEVTGYVLVFFVDVPEITIANLKIIWGEKLFHNDGLHVDSSRTLQHFNLPSLRSVQYGNITVRHSPHLCNFDHRFGTVDYYELMGPDYRKRLSIRDMSAECEFIAPCSERCMGSCFGPNADECQTIYRRMCTSCASGMCYFDATNVTRCCDEVCAAGCYGDGKDKCVACSNFEQDGRCVAECRGTHRYNPQTLVKEELPDNEKRFNYERHCVRECPAGTIIEDRYCVSRCSPNKYRDVKIDDRMCIPCNGPCPKTCTLKEPLNAVNIRNLVNCSEIDGNIEVLSHVFEEHLSDTATSFNMSKVPALRAADLEVLRTVRIVTGHVAIDGGLISNPNKPRSLDFLSNLEMIEGRRLYYEKFALYVIGNEDLRSLGLKSLRKVRTGHVSFSRNRNLCYGYTIDYEKLLNVNQTIWKENMPPADCEAFGRKCHRTCDPAMGCWGPGPSQCVRCQNFFRDGICADECPTAGGYFIPSEKSKQAADDCLACHPECLICSGTSANECSKCRNFEWHHPLKNKMECVSRCPNSTYALGHRCEPCHESCYIYGCSGPGSHWGTGGCNKCQYSVEDIDGTITCLVGETEESACLQNNLNHHYVAVGSSNTSRYACRPCRSECAKCRTESVSVRYCDCAHYKLVNLAKNGTDDICVHECGRGSMLHTNKTETEPGVCHKCHHLCDAELSCTELDPLHCEKCAFAGISLEGGSIECLHQCPDNKPYPYDGLCHEDDQEALARRRRNYQISGLATAIITVFIVFAYLVYRCRQYHRKYKKEVTMHLPEIPPQDTNKVTQRPNMRRIILIAVDELDDSKKSVLGQGAFGTVYAGKWKPPAMKTWIPVAIKAINQTVPHRATEAEMMKEASVMASVQHEHLLPLVGICMAKSGVKIVTILRPMGSLLKFLQKHENTLCSKYLMIYMYQISSAMAYLARRKIVHRDLAARNVLVRKPNHVEVTDFGLAQMLQGSEPEEFEGLVAVKWLAYESLKDSLFSEKSDVWSFGVTCWEILTFGQAPYKDLQIHVSNMRKELRHHFEQGRRLRQPPICSQPLYNELLNCWLLSPQSRPTFEDLKKTFERFCRTPNVYIQVHLSESTPRLQRLLQDRQATAQRLDSITDTEQRDMIERLLQDSDFVDPADINPTDYAPGRPLDSPGHSPFNDMTMETTLPDSPTSHTRPLISIDQRHGSTASSRYKADPLRRHTSSGGESRLSGLDMDEENYLMPKSTSAGSNRVTPIPEEGLIYTPVVASKEAIGEPGASFPNLDREYYNDPNKGPTDKKDSVVHSAPYVNAEKESAL